MRDIILKLLRPFVRFILETCDENYALRKAAERTRLQVKLRDTLRDLSDEWGPKP